MCFFSFSAMHIIVTILFILRVNLIVLQSTCAIFDTSLFYKVHYYFFSECARKHTPPLHLSLFFSLSFCLFALACSLLLSFSLFRFCSAILFPPFSLFSLFCSLPIVAFTRTQNAPLQKWTATCSRILHLLHTQYLRMET